jgi:hypothetical protein
MLDTKNNRPLVRNTGWKRINEQAVGENIIMRVQLLSSEAKHVSSRISRNYLFQWAMRPFQMSAVALHKTSRFHFTLSAASTHTSALLFIATQITTRVFPPKPKCLNILTHNSTLHDTRNSSTAVVYRWVNKKYEKIISFSSVICHRLACDIVTTI